MNFYDKPLSALSDKEWEQICLRCGKCCVCKYDGNDVIYFSNYMCKFFNIKKGLCSCYNERFVKAGNLCRKVDMDLLENHIEMLPTECAYRRLYEGRGLPSYHPLLTGDANSAIKARQTVKSLPVISEDAREKALNTLLRKIKKNHWSEAQIKQKLAEINDKYALRWLESHPLPSK